jgi:manganese-dependent inorganic pyrophosphatase
MDNYWYYTLSAIPQTLAAMIALAATFFVFKINTLSEKMDDIRSSLSRFIILLAPPKQGEIHVIERKTNEEFFEFYKDGLGRLDVARDNLGLEHNTYLKLQREMRRKIEMDWNSSFSARGSRIIGYLTIKRDTLCHLLSTKKMIRGLLKWDLWITASAVFLALFALPNYDFVSGIQHLVVYIILVVSLISVLYTARSVWKIATVDFNPLPPPSRRDSCAARLGKSLKSALLWIQKRFVRASNQKISMKPILITGYVNPDLDAVAGAIGYAEYLSKTGKSCEVGIIGEPHDEAKYLLDRFGFPYPKSILNSDNYDEVILVDASDLNGLEGRVVPEKVIEIIDHRKVHEADKFINAKTQIEFVGAAATLIAEKFILASVPISRESATLIYGAIISNTLNFKSTTTTDRDREAADWLNQTAQQPESFVKDLFAAKSDLSDTKLTKRIEDDFAWFTIGNKRVGIAQIELLGAQELIDKRELEIITVLNKLKDRFQLDFVFQNTIGLEEDKNLFVTDDKPTQELLNKALGVKFSGCIAARPGLIMRKQIVPLLKAALENSTSTRS